MTTETNGMSHIQIVDDEVDLQTPTLIEGFPGAGLVGKIVVDHMVDEMGLTHYANVHCDGVDQVAVYDKDTPQLASPIRLYVDETGEVLVLQSDIPVKADAAEEFAACFAPWLENNAMPVFVAGLPTQNREGPRQLFGVGTGGGIDVVDRADLARPPERGVVSGPAGSLLGHAVERGRDAVGLIVECDPRFPDPVASRVLLEQGIGPIIGRDVSVERLESQAEQIQEAKERLAEQMQDGGDVSSEAMPVRMFQ